MHIEIVGTPASGKSTSARAVDDELYSAGVITATRKSLYKDYNLTLADWLRNLGAALWYGCKHPIITGQIFYYTVICSIQRKKVRRVFRVFTFSLAIKVLQEKADEVSLSDQGMLQFFVFSVTAKQLQAKNNPFKKFYELLYPPSVPLVIVQTKTPPEVINERCRKRRQQGQTDGTEVLPENVLIEREQNTEAVLDVLASEYKKVETVAVSGVENTETIATKIISKAVELDKQVEEENILPERLHKRYG